MSNENTDSWRKFKEAKLSPNNTFYSKFNIRRMNDQDYEYADNFGIS